MPFPIPEVIRHATRFALGVAGGAPRARRSGSSGRTHGSTPPKERKAAESLVAAGADVLGQNVDSPAAGQYAESKGIPWVGYDSNAQKFAPNSWLTAAIYNWGLYYLRRVKAAIERHVEDGLLLRHLKDGFIGSRRSGPRSRAKTKALIAAKRKALTNGTFYEFAGPLYDQSGQAPRAEGQALTVQEIVRDELAREGRDR